MTTTMFARHLYPAPLENDWENVFSFENLNERALPISPPAPHRRAPKPPTYTPRRRRGRHMPIRAPALSGLFTVTEEAEPISPVSLKASTRSDLQSIPSASASSECLAPSPRISSRAEAATDFPQDVDMDADMEEILLSDVDMSSRDRRASWESTESRSSDESLRVITPNLEEDDPFFSPSPFTFGRTSPEWPELSTPALVLPNESEPAVAETSPAQLPSLGSAFKFSSPSFDFAQAANDFFDKTVIQLADSEPAHPFSAAALASTSTLPRDFGARSWSGNAPLFRRSAPPPPRLDLAADRRRLSYPKSRGIAKRQELLPPAEILPSRYATPRTPSRSGPRPPKNRLASPPLETTPQVRRAHHSLSCVLDGYHAVDPQKAFASLVLEAGESNDEISSASDTDDESFAQLGMAFPLPPVRSSLSLGSPLSAKSSDEPDTPWSADLRAPGSARDGFNTPPLQYPRLKSAVMPSTPFVPLRKYDEDSARGRWQMSRHDVLQGWSSGSSTPSLVSSTGTASSSADSWGSSLASSTTSSRSSSSRRSGRLPKRGKLPTFA